MLMQIVSFILPFLSLFFVTSLYVKLTKKKYGDCFPITLVSLPLIVLLSHYIFKNLIYGIYLTYVIIVLSIVFFCLNIKNEDYKNRIFSNGFVAYVFIYTFIYLIFRNSYYFAWDEFAHWGPMINQMVNTDKMYINVSHAAYPPLIQNFEYVMVKLGLLFEEYNIKFAVHVFNFSIFCVPVSERFASIRTNKKSILKILGTFIMSFLLAVGLDAYNTFGTIYHDVTVSMFFAYMIYLLIYKEDIRVISIMSFAFMLVKDISILFILLLLVYNFIDFVCEYKQNDKKAITKEFIKVTLAIIIPAIISYLLWHIYKAQASLLNDQFAISNFDINKFFEIFTGNLNGERLVGFNHFYFDVFNYNLSKGPLLISYFVTFIIINLIVIACTIISETEHKLKNFLRIFIFVTISYIVYTIFMTNLYVNIFTGIERTGSASFGRYMSSFVLGIYLISYVYIIKCLKQEKFLLLIYMIVALIFGMSYFGLILNPNTKKEYLTDPIRHERLGYQQLHSKLESGEKAIVVLDKEYWAELVKDYYSARDTRIEIYDVKDFNEMGNMRKFFSKLDEYKYIYIADVENTVLDSFISRTTYYNEKNQESKYDFAGIKSNEIIDLRNIGDLS